MKSYFPTYSWPLTGWPGGAFANMAFQASMLAVESSQVITLRLAKMAMGGPDVQREAELMVSEKLAAMADCGALMMKAAMVGKHDLGADKMMQLYRRKVRANRRRLGS